MSVTNVAVERPTSWADVPLLLTVPEAGQLIGLGRNASYEAIKRGELPARRIGRRMIVYREDVRRIFDHAQPNVGTARD